MAGPAKFWIGRILVAVAAVVILRDGSPEPDPSATPTAAGVNAGSTAGGDGAAAPAPARSRASFASSGVLDTPSIDDAVSTAQAQAPAVAIFYSIADSTSRHTVTRIAELAREEATGVTILGFAIDVETPEELATFQRETGAGFGSQVLTPWARGEVQTAVRRFGIGIRDPWVLPLVVVVGDDGEAIAAWEGLRTVDLLAQALRDAGWASGS